MKLVSELTGASSVSQGRPTFIVREVFRTWMKPASLNKFALIGGILPSSYIAREARLGRPVKSIEDPALYRMLDLVARARANADEISPTEECQIKIDVDELRRERSSLRNEVEAARHVMALETASVNLTGKTLLSEGEIVAGAVGYAARCGVYFLIKDERVRYVGQSVNVDTRLRDHSGNYDFDAVSIIPCDRSILDKLESLYIHLLKPDWNGRVASRHGELPVAPLSLEHLLGAATGESLASIKTTANNRARFWGNNG